MPAPEPIQTVFDMLSPENRANPYPYYRAARELGPLVPTPLGAHLVTGHDDCMTVLSDPRWGHGYSAGISPIRPGVAADDIPGSFIRMDPPDHTRLRGLVSKAFTPREVVRLRPLVERTAEHLVDRALGSTEFDLVSDLAAVVPITVICELLGAPIEDYQRFDAWARALARGLDPDALLSADELRDRATAAAAFGEYFRGLVAERRARPGPDLISQLAAIDDAGDRITETELLDICVLLLFGGYETTVHMTGNMVLALNRHPDQLDLLRERPDLIPAAVDELLRFDPPVQFTNRVALRERRLAGRVFARGEAVVILIAGANRDPRVFPDPDRLDVTRFAGPGSAPRHLAFGLGAHFCLGAQLARMELEIVLATLLRHAPGLTVLDPAPSYRETLTIRGLRSLRVRLEAAGIRPDASPADQTEQAGRSVG
ncbi:MULTISPECIES: cytochrome P450 [unclassified Parafrankia]|uniref:cytochrome P450 n=1 Tax=unclassified Parafrankia TaxID=2994368 RepID=UPI000DA554FD|nr:MULTISPECIES: cytochrome P450 [unclassified Parafrankia]TCJ40068.1 cytochrome P450 [Parafrankia sp. BMG5.11]SQD94543.1 Cytochrome P450 [Parafrankia sp. Ea1.12]